MRAWSFIALFMLGIGQPRPKQDNATQKEYQKGKQTPAPPAVPTVSRAITKPASQIKQACPDGEKENIWDEAFGPVSWPNWALVIAGLGAIAVALRTLRVIARQTDATEDAADAAKASAEALINSERAWVLVEIGRLPTFKPDPNKLEILWIFPTIKNYGKTVARITRVTGIVKLIPEGQNLPVVPEYVPGQGFDDQIDMVLPPQVPIQPRLAVSGDEFIKVQDGKLFLFVHGFIEYLDGISEKQRRSAYCFGYVIQAGYSPAETGFYPYLAAPRAYTECT